MGGPAANIEPPLSCASSISPCATPDEESGRTRVRLLEQQTHPKCRRHCATTRVGPDSPAPVLQSWKISKQRVLPRPDPSPTRVQLPADLVSPDTFKGSRGEPLVLAGFGWVCQRRSVSCPVGRVQEYENRGVPEAELMRSWLGVPLHFPSGSGLWV